MFRSIIETDEIAKLPLKAFGGDIIVVDEFEQLDSAVDFLKKQGILGFDTETKPSFRKGNINKVALLQLSTDKKAYLFRINKIGFPDNLKNILADPKIIKTGVAIHDDIKKLQKINNFEAKGFVELQKLVINYGINNFSLLKLAGIILGFRISKNKRLSNWENKDLKEGQRLYAATDAWVGYKIYNALLKSKKIS